MLGETLLIMKISADLNRLRARAVRLWVKMARTVRLWVKKARTVRLWGLEQSDFDIQKQYKVNETLWMDSLNFYWPRYIIFSPKNDLKRSAPMSEYFSKKRHFECFLLLSEYFWTSIFQKSYGWVRDFYRFSTFCVKNHPNIRFPSVFQNVRGNPIKHENFWRCGF